MTEQYNQINANINPRGARYIASSLDPGGSGPFLLTFDDDIIIADTVSGAPLILTLPLSSEFEGFEITVHAPNGSTADVIIQPLPPGIPPDGTPGGDTIFGPGAVLLNINNQAVKLAAQFNFDIDVNDPEVPPVLVRRGWYCTGECAGRDPIDCPEIDKIDPTFVTQGTGVQGVTMTGTFSTDVPDVLFPGTLLTPGALSETGLTPTDLDFDIDTDIVEPGVYYIGVFRGDGANCFDFIEFTVNPAP